jgi:hypothetical protein
MWHTRERRKRLLVCAPAPFLCLLVRETNLIVSRYVCVLLGPSFAVFTSCPFEARVSSSSLMPVTYRPLSPSVTVARWCLRWRPILLIKAALVARLDSLPVSTNVDQIRGAFHVGTSICLSRASGVEWDMLIAVTSGPARASIVKVQVMFSKCPSLGAATFLHGVPNLAELR